MSDKARRLAAMAAGRRAYWDGTSVLQNPMRARDSRSAWEMSWNLEKAWDDSTAAALRDLFRQRKERREGRRSP